MADKTPINEHEATLGKIRDRLESVFRSLTAVQSVLVVTGEVLNSDSADCDSDIAMVLMRCASNPLHEEMKELTSIIEGLGGKTSYSSDEDDYKDDGDA